MICPECDGDGVIYTTEDMPCPECDGTGEVEGEDEDSEDCPRCQGSGGGPENWRCPDCHGTGVDVAAKRRSREEYLEDYWVDARKDRDFDERDF